MSLQSLCDQAAQHQKAGRMAEAEQLYRQVLVSDPDNFTAVQMMAVIRYGQNRLPEALEFFERAAILQPGFAAFSNRGAALQALGRFDEALASYDAALTLAPRNAVLSYNRGRVLEDLGRFEEARQSYEAALALDPASAPTLNNLGNVLRQLKRHSEAMASYDRALVLKPDYAEALYNRGDLRWAGQGDYPGAMNDLERAAALDPNYDYLLGELLYLRMHGGDWRDFDTLRARIDQAVRTGRHAVQPFHYQALSNSPADLQACSVLYTRRHFPPLPPLASTEPHGRARIRLGYVAGEFREHATAHLMAGLFEQHDRDKFEVLAFDNGWDDGSAIRSRLAAAFDGIVDISLLSNRDAAEQIRAREVDILVNLNGYVGLHRMAVFAHRPAPLQVNYLGFPATAGAPYMDYILADDVLIPSGEERFYTEQVVRLPNSYQINDSKRAIAVSAPTRAELGLPETGFVFCSFNSSYKLTPHIFALWMDILKDTPESVLWLLESNPGFAANLRRAATARGVAADRLVFAPMIAADRHLARMARADLFLDLLPCGAHTTASDALWTGLPLVTCRGSAFPGRVAASLLAAVGLPELVMENLADYKSLVLRLAANPAELSALRSKLAANRLATPLFDTIGSCRRIERAFSTMWEMFRQGEAPRGFSVPPG